MTHAADLALPWRALDCHLAPWRVVLRSGDHVATFRAEELLDVCAAAELERYPGDVVRATVRHRAQGRRAPLSWRDLVDGADGLTRRHALGERTLGWCLDECGVELVRFEYEEAA